MNTPRAVPSAETYDATDQKPPGSVSTHSCATSVSPAAAASATRARSSAGSCTTKTLARNAS